MNIRVKSSPTIKIVSLYFFVLFVQSDVDPDGGQSSD